MSTCLRPLVFSGLFLLGCARTNDAPAEPPGDMRPAPMAEAGLPADPGPAQQSPGIEQPPPAVAEGQPPTEAGPPAQDGLPPPEGAPVEGAPQAVASPLDGLVGNYRYIGGKRQRQGIEKAVDDVTDEMNIMIRGIAEDRLLKANDVPRQISIQREGDAIIVVIDGRTYKARPGGETVRVKNSEGGTSAMRFELKNDRLYQYFSAEDGRRVNVFAPYADGQRLNLWVTVASPRLPKDVKYRLTYSE